MFDLKKILNGRMNVPEPEVHTAGTAITPGMALTLSNGVLNVCAPTSTPTHISMGIAESGKKVAVAPVNSAQIYETELSDTPSAALKEGQKVGIYTDGLGADSSKAGAATIVAVNGATKQGDKITVRF